MLKQYDIIFHIRHRYLFQDLDEDVVITLTAKDPQAPKNKIRFDHNSGL